MHQNRLKLVNKQELFAAVPLNTLEDSGGSRLREPISQFIAANLCKLRGPAAGWVPRRMAPTNSITTVNYFRSIILQRAAGLFVTVTLLTAVIMPMSRVEALAMDHAAVQLFGRSLDLPVDRTFLNSWDVALQSDATTLDGFVEAFVRSYEKANDIENGSISSNPHVLWSILKGISLNIDPWGVAATLSSALKSSTVSASSVSIWTARSVTSERGPELDPLNEIGHASAAGFVAALLTEVNPQGP